MLILSTALAGPLTFDLGGDLGVRAWHRAGDHALLLSPGVTARLSGPKMGTTLSVDVARSREANSVLTSRVVPIQVAGTLDGLWTRRRTVFRFGVGLALAVTQATVKDDDQRFSGWRAGPALRVRAGTEFPLSKTTAWTVDAGTSVRDEGVDADLRTGLSIRLSGGNR